MSDQDFKEKIFDELTAIRGIVQEGFANSDRRMDKQDIEILDIKDQIKGNPDKDIKGIVSKLRELYSVLIIPIFVKKLPTWVKWGIAAITVNGIADINSMGLIAFVKWFLHNIKPF